MLEYVIGISLFSLLVALVLSLIILKQPAGTAKMQEISEIIHQGALTFLKKEYEVLSVFLLIVSLILYFFIDARISISFIFGGISSALAGNIGMRIATKSNARTTEATKKHIGEGLKIAFYSGAVMGMSVVGIGLLGVSILYLAFNDPNIIYGFGFGASSIALFARVGGGIYTKAADVGADLVGKVEKGIPEDDPRNPAVIADNVGDNVGDVAGMGADLFESYVNSIVAAMAIGLLAFNSKEYLVLPLMLAGLGIIASIIGVLFVRAKDDRHLFSAMNKGLYSSTIIAAILSFAYINYRGLDIGIFYAALSGLIAGVIIGLFTQYCTSNSHRPTQSIAVAAKTGAGTNVIQGLAVGMMSTLIPVLAVSMAVLIAYNFAGLYGIAMSGVGMLATLGFTLAIETYGAVADNAAGISEMAKVGKDVREKTELLDAVGNTNAAIGKGFAIGSAALTALALFASFTQITKISVMSISDPKVIIGLFIGGMLPFLFSSFAMQAVGNAAQGIVEEVRRQFREIKGLMQGKAKPDYNKCIAISTRSALKQMIAPSLLAILAPIIMGKFFGLEALGGLLVGSIVTGFSLALFMANSGGAWDNAKKYIEAGNFGGKGSDAHKAAVVGDTVGDPFKDTAGPSLNILIKLMSIVAIVAVPMMV